MLTHSDDRLGHSLSFQRPGSHRPPGLVPAPWPCSRCPSGPQSAIWKDRALACKHRLPACQPDVKIHPLFPSQSNPWCQNPATLVPINAPDPSVGLASREIPTFSQQVNSHRS